MENSLLYLAEEELLNEAKRVVPIVYEENELLSCKSVDAIREAVNPLYKEFYTEMELRVIPLCCMKNEDKDYFVDGKHGKLHIHTHEGAIAVLESNCPHQDCVHMGYVSDTSHPIICAYNAVYITIGVSPNDVDT